MNKDIMQAAGFSKEVEEVEMGNCPFCHLPIIWTDFRDNLSMKEYNISGLCQACQNKMFGDYDDN